MNVGHYPTAGRPYPFWCLAPEAEDLPVLKMTRKPARTWINQCVVASEAAVDGNILVICSEQTGCARLGPGTTHYRRLVEMRFRA
jgi:hypothetical protein